MVFVRGVGRLGKRDVFYNPSAVLSVVFIEDDEVFYELDYDDITVEHLPVKAFQEMLTREGFRKDDSG
jgi:hypothetical protein